MATKKNPNKFNYTFNGKNIELPRFDKLGDRRIPESQWPAAGEVDLLVFEGWFLGTPAQDAAPRKKTPRTRRPIGRRPLPRNSASKVISQWQGGECRRGSR